MKLFGILFVAFVMKASADIKGEFSETCDLGSKTNLRLLRRPDTNETAKGIDFTDRKRVTACDFPQAITVKSGSPVNPAGSSLKSGKGAFPYWGPNVLTQMAIVKRWHTRLFYMPLDEEKNMFLQNLAPSAELGFESTEMRHWIELATEKAMSKLMEGGMDEEKASEQILEEIKSSTKIVMAGNIPWPENTKNAWIEVQTKMITCHKKHAFCTHGILQVAAEKELVWKKATGSSKNDKTTATKTSSLFDLEVPLADVPLYSAFCHLKDRSQVLHGYKKNALKVRLVLGVTILATLGVVGVLGIGLAVFMVWLVFKVIGLTIGALKCLYALVRG